MLTLATVFPKFLHPLHRTLSFSLSRKRVRDMEVVKISFPDSGPITDEEQPRIDYTSSLQEIRSLGWENMDFAELCSLSSRAIKGIEM